MGWNWTREGEKDCAKLLRLCNLGRCRRGKKGRRNGSEHKEDEEVTGIQEYLMRKSEKYRGPSVGEYRVVNSEGGDWNGGLSPLRLNRREEERHGTIQGRVVSFKRV